MMMKAAARNRARRNLIALCGHVVYSDLSRRPWCCVCTGTSMSVVYSAISHYRKPKHACTVQRSMKGHLYCTYCTALPEAQVLSV